MAVEFRRVMTAKNAAGESVVVEDAVIDGAHVQMMPGREFRVVWGSDAAVSLDAGPVLHPFFPPAGGNRWGIVVYEPESAIESTVGPGGPTPEQLSEAAAKVPGLVSAYEEGVPGMHTTETLDYGYIVEGELTLELDDGVQVALSAGTCVVQRGTRHKWRNLGTERATLMYVMLGIP